MSYSLAIDHPRSLSLPLQRLILSFVWLTFFLNGFVIREPAPCDVFMMGFVVLIPLLGLMRFTILHGLFFIGWMIVVATGLLAAGLHEFTMVSVRHMVITAYLAVFAVVLAAFVTQNPAKHLALIWNGYMCGAVVAAFAAIIGYFDLIPGSFELFTKYSRARGTFKDPNVFGPFLVPAFLYCLHHFLSHSLRKGFIPLLFMGLFLFGILMCFSRGAWMLLAIASAFYIVIFFVTAQSNRQRMRTIFLCGLSLVALIGVVLIALQSPKVKELWEVRVSLSQSYDVGDGGRFTGHKKAVNLIVEKPMGIGALYFGYFYHHELPHNLYLSMYLSSGWIGGTVFLLLMLTTLFLGLSIVLRRSPWIHYHAIATATFVGLAVESYIIDSDHWRQLYIIMALIWGAYAATQIEDKNSLPIERSA